MEFDVFVGGSGKKLTDFQKQALPDFGVNLADGAIDNKSYAVVKKWLEGVITLAKQNLANSGAIASDSLSASIDFEPITLTDTSFVVAIVANDYWKFVDLGVKGAVSSFSTGTSGHLSVPSKSGLRLRASRWKAEISRQPTVPSPSTSPTRLGGKAYGPPTL
jgi:hypothetical protein